MAILKTSSLILASFLMIFVFLAGCIESDTRTEISNGSAASNKTALAENGTSTPIIEPKSNSNESELARITSFVLDKQRYGSYEIVKFSLGIESKANFSNVSLEISGISPYGYSHISVGRDMNLSAGLNAIEINATTPRCTSGCGGVVAGNYDLFANLFHDGNLIANASSTIELVSN